MNGYFLSERLIYKLRLGSIEGRSYAYCVRVLLGVDRLFNGGVNEIILLEIEMRGDSREECHLFEFFAVSGDGFLSLHENVVEDLFDFGNELHW